MHRAAERYHQQQRQQEEEQGRDDGYDEDWDDDVYYAAAVRPDSSGAGSGSGAAPNRDGSHARGGEGGDGGGGSGGSTRKRSGSERPVTKRHYMKVPNMRHIRAAMRPTPATATPADGGFALGLGSTFQDLQQHSRGVVRRSPSSSASSSPRLASVVSTDTDGGNTPFSSTTTSFGDGSSVPPLGQLTPPREEEGGEEDGSGCGVGGEASGGVPASPIQEGARLANPRPPESPPRPGSPRSTSSAATLEGRGSKQEASIEAHERGSAAAAESIDNRSSLVHLRGSPRRGGRNRQQGSPVGERSSLGSTRASISASGGLRQQQEAKMLPQSPVSPEAITAGVTAGVAAGVAAAAASGKRKRPLTATAGVAAGGGQRVGATAWPKIRRRADSPPSRATPPRKHPGTGAGEGITGGTKRRPVAASARNPFSRHSAAAAAATSNGVLGTSTGSSPSNVAKSPPRRLPQPSPLSSPSNLSSSSSRRQHPQAPKGRKLDKSKGPAPQRDGAAASAGRGRSSSGGGSSGEAEREVKAAAARAGRPSLTDRPARWASAGGKGGGSKAWSPLRAPGASSTSRAGAGSRGSNARSSSSASSVKKTPGRSRSAFSPSQGPGGFPSPGNQVVVICDRLSPPQPRM